MSNPTLQIRTVKGSFQCITPAKREGRRGRDGQVLDGREGEKQRQDCQEGSKMKRSPVGVGREVREQDRGEVGGEYRGA